MTVSLVWRLAALWFIGALVLQSCGFWQRRSASAAKLAGVVTELAQIVAGAEVEGEIAWLGFRDAKGEKGLATEVLDDFLVSALLLDGVPLMVPEKLAGEKWEEDELLPARLWTDLDACRILTGRLEEEGAWMYLRLFLIDSRSRQLLASTTRRVAGRHLREQVAQRRSQEEGRVAEIPLEVDLHLLGLRSQGGIAHSVAIEEGTALQTGDRLQIRFKVARDCEVYAFLYSSEGVREDLFGSQFVYSGRWQYGPGEEQWVDLEESDQVYTLYFLAGEHLLEEKEELWERMAELVEQRRVDRFAGLELLDQTLVEFLLRELEGEPEIGVLRGGEGIGRGEKESFILADGTPLESRAEKLSSPVVLVRAFSFSVQ